MNYTLTNVQLWMCTSYSNSCIDMIKQNVSWMGFTPTDTFSASQYFGQIYEWTIQLIKMGKAYVCKLPQEQMRQFKVEMIPSPYRDSDVETNLREFELMRTGAYQEGQAVLRAKIDYKSPNTTLRDPVLYRVLYTAHPVTKNEWCIYPTYDYAHPLSDSIENITHSCCTLEFETRRELYYWPLQQLNLYKPFVWEFSRLNLTHTLKAHSLDSIDPIFRVVNEQKLRVISCVLTLTSKRKIQRLIQDGVVTGWDDPRLFTISGLRRRGIPLAALNEFLDRVPVTRRGNENFIQLSFFEHIIRQWLDKHAPRLMGVRKPVPILLNNYRKGMVADLCNKSFTGQRFPSQRQLNEVANQKNTYELTLSETIFLDEFDVSKYSPAGEGSSESIIKLKYGPYLAVKWRDPLKKDQLEGTLYSDYAGNEKNCPILNWVSQNDALKCQLRIYDRLFVVDKPEQDPSDPQGIHFLSKIVE